MKRMAAATGVVVALAGCGGGGSSTKSVASNGGGDTPATGTTTPAAAKGRAVVVDRGFGQRGEYVWVTALVRNDTGDRGQSVTVSFNLYGNGHQLLKSDTQVEAFTRVGETVAIGTQEDLPGEKVRSVSASVSLEPGVFTDGPSMKVPIRHVTVATDEFGHPTVKVTVHNPTGTTLRGTRMGAVCYRHGHINGGGSAYPDAIPPRSDYLVTFDALITSGAPSRCVVTADPSDM